MMHAPTPFRGDTFFSVAQARNVKKGGEQHVREVLISQLEQHSYECLETSRSKRLMPPTTLGIHFPLVKTYVRKPS